MKLAVRLDDAPVTAVVEVDAIFVDRVPVIEETSSDEIDVL